MGQREADLSKNLKDVFGLPDDARAWLMSLWNLIQIFDDMADGDHPDRDDLDNAIFDAIVNMPENPFFIRHKDALLPLLAIAILKWKASDTAERAGEADAISFVWRAGFYDIVLAVVHICHGQQVALDVCHHIMRLYGEDFVTYCEEFDDA